MIKTILIDDEEQARAALRSLLHEFFPEVEIIGEAGSHGEAVALLSQAKPDLVLLDVMLQTGTGFDVLAQLGEWSFHVIFVTAHPDYAYQSIRTNAVDYLLKPVRIKDLRTALDRVKERIGSVTEVDSRIVVRSSSTDQAANLTVVPDSTGYAVLRLDEIIRCEASRNYTVLHMRNGKQIVAVRTISDFETAFLNFGFVRVHKSHLINLYAIARYIRGRGGELEMLDGSLVPVARDRKEELLDKFLR